MFDVVAGGREALRERPFALMYNEPVSPLGFARENMEKLLYAAEMGVPSVFMSGLLCGGTAPVTPAGGLVLGNAESLAGVLIAQLKRRGAPVVSGGGILGMDMRTMAPSYSTPEFMLTMAAFAELAQYYGLPAWGYAGCSDAKTFDAQAAADTAEWVLMAALSGSNLVHDVGFLESGLTSSFDQLVFADEAIAKCSRLVGGMVTDAEALAVGAVADVGPGGHFLAHRHTSKHFRENWPAELEDRMNHGSWVAAGAQTMEQRVRAKVLDLLETHEAPGLPADVDAELVRLVGDVSR
jgi:trimethylamine--corrinoid protein Co-methyltransferase